MTAEHAAKRGRPPGSLAWGARLCATIAGRLVSQTDALAVTRAAKAALDASYSLASDKQNWRKGSDAAAVELVRQTFYRLRKTPHLAVQPSPTLMLHAQAALENQVNELKRAKELADASAQAANALHIQREIDKISEPVKQARTFADSQERARAALHAQAREQGVKLSAEAIEGARVQQREALRQSVKSRAPRPFATTKHK
ncbi:MAG: hypothetical protein WCV99_04265 [Sterolibacterium sp.]